MSKRQINFDDVKPKQTPLIPNEDLLSIIKTLVSYLYGCPNQLSFENKQRELDTYNRSVGDEQFFKDVHKIIKQNISFEISMFAAALFKRLSNVTEENAKLIYDLVTSKIPPQIKNILLDFFEKVGIMNVFEGLLKEIQTNKINVHIIERMLSNENIKPNFKHLTFFVSYDVEFNIYCKVIKKFIEKNLNFKSVDLDNCLSMICKKNNFKLCFEFIEFLKIVLEKYGRIIDNKFKEIMIQKIFDYYNKNMHEMLQRNGVKDQNKREHIIGSVNLEGALRDCGINNPNMIAKTIRKYIDENILKLEHYEAIFQIVNAYKVQNPNVGKAIIEKFVIPAIIFDVHIEDENLVKLFGRDLIKRKVQIRNKREAAKYIMSRLFDCVNIKVIFDTWYNTKRFNDERNIIGIELLKCFVNMEKVKEVLSRIFYTDTYKCLTSDVKLKLKLSHIDLIYLLVKNNYFRDHSESFAILNGIFNMKKVVEHQVHDNEGNTQIRKEQSIIKGNPLLIFMNKAGKVQYSSVYTINMVKLICKIFECGEFDDMDDTPIDNVIDTFLKAIIDPSISVIAIKLFYKFMTFSVEHMDRKTKNKIIGFFFHEMKELNFGNGKFMYYFFESLSIIVRSFEIMRKEGVYILNMQVARICQRFKEVLYETNSMYLKCFIIQLLILVNYYQLTYVDIDWNKVMNNEGYNVSADSAYFSYDDRMDEDDNSNITEKVIDEETLEKKLCAELMYLKTKYNIVKLYRHMTGINYFLPSGHTFTYPSMRIRNKEDFQAYCSTYGDRDDVPSYKDIKVATDEALERVAHVQNGLCFAKVQDTGRRFFFDFLVSTIRFFFSQRMEYNLNLMISQIKHDNVKNFPNLSILVASYIIMKDGKNINENALEKMIMILEEGIKYAHSIREFKIIGMVLSKFGIKVDKPKKFKEESYTNLFLRMIYLKEARVYSIEDNKFKR